MRECSGDVEKKVLGVAEEYEVGVESIECEEREDPAADRVHVNLSNGSYFHVCKTPLLKIETEAKIRKLQ